MRATSAGASRGKIWSRRVSMALVDPSLTAGVSPASLTRSNRRGTDPYARWCGRGGVARCPPIPIKGRQAVVDLRDLEGRVPLFAAVPGRSPVTDGLREKQVRSLFGAAIMRRIEV